MRERQSGFDCVIVLFKREGGCGGGGGDCYFGIAAVPIQGSSVDLVPRGVEMEAPCDRTEKYCRCLLFVCDQTSAHAGMRFPFRADDPLMFMFRSALQARWFPV